MRKNFIKMITEAAISNTDIALNVESMSDQIQSMIEKITNIKTKDLAVLVKKIKYDNNIKNADEFNQNIGSKLDELIQSMTSIKGEIDNVTVSMLNGDNNFGDDSGSDLDNDLDTDFGNEDNDEEDSDNLDDDLDIDVDIDNEEEPVNRKLK